MDRETFFWISLALIAALAAAPALGTGGVPWLALFLLTVTLSCAAHDGSRRLVVETARRHLSDHALRTTVIVIAAMPVVFLLPVELALLMADGVLTYLEVLAAVSLIAANTQFKVVKARVGRFIARAPARVAYRRCRRSVKMAMTRLRSPPPEDDDPAWAF